MRRVLVGVLGLCLILGACSGESDLAEPSTDDASDTAEPAATATDISPEPTSGTPGERVRETSVSWDFVVLGDEPNATTISFIGRPVGNLDTSACAGEYDVELVETEVDVRITLYRLAIAGEAPTECLLLGDQREMTVVLEEPLAGRAVVDGHDGSTKLEADLVAQVPATDPAIDVEVSDAAWSAAESTRDVANYLEALRQGAYEQAAWPAYGNGILFEGQSPDETGADFLARMCAGGLCTGPYLVQGQEGVVVPETSQSSALVTVAHFEAGKRSVITLVTFEGQRVIAQLPPLVASPNEASLRESLFGDDPPQHVVVERFDAFEIWDGSDTTWVTNWFAEAATHIEGDVVATRSGAFGVSDPQDVIDEGCVRLMERDGDVLLLAGCDGSWDYTNLSTGAMVEPPITAQDLGDGESSWFSERGGVVLVGELDAEGNLGKLATLDGVDLLGDDYASQVVISGDGTQVAYVDHNDPEASSHFWSPVVVVRDIATGDEVGRWTLNGSVICLDFGAEWVVACDANDSTRASRDPDQAALVAINPTTSVLNRAATPTRIFLPLVPPTPNS